MSEHSAAVAHPHPALSQLAALHHFRTYVDVGVVVVVLAITNQIAHFTTPWANIAVVPAAAVGLVGYFALKRVNRNAALAFAAAAIAPEVTRTIGNRVAGVSGYGSPDGIDYLPNLDGMPMLIDSDEMQGFDDDDGIDGYDDDTVAVDGYDDGDDGSE